MSSSSDDRSALRADLSPEDLEVKLQIKTWEESVAEAKARGGVVHTPNNLPIRCIKYDWTMWEHEHADHPDYIFPVEAEFVGEGPCECLIDNEGNEVPLPPEEELAMRKEDHALIYSDSCIAVTLHNDWHHMWSLNRRPSLMSIGRVREGWQLTQASVEAIRERCKDKNTDW